MFALLTLLLASAGAAPTIHLYTMGPGEHPFSRFGHAAMCVRDEGAATGRCYNYGTADFSTPVPLSWDFVRGRAQFWVSLQRERAMIAAYEREDRSLYRQELPLSPEVATALASALDASTAEDVKYYRYHHFHDNCTTRLRDLIDAHTDGALSRGADRAADPSFRTFARRGLSGSLPLLLAGDLALGRGSDQPTTRWQAMFLPDVLREEVQARLGVAAEVLYTRKAPLTEGRSWAGQAAMLGFGAALGAIALLLPARLGRALAGLSLGFPALLLWALAAATALPELRWNEALLVLWPTDLLLPLLSPARARRYLDLRLVGLALVSGFSAAGVLSQPLVAPAAMVALAALGLRRRGA